MENGDARGEDGDGDGGSASPSPRQPQLRAAPYAYVGAPRDAYVGATAAADTASLPPPLQLDAVQQGPPHGRTGRYYCGSGSGGSSDSHGGSGGGSAGSGFGLGRATWAVAAPLTFAIRPFYQ